MLIPCLGTKNDDVEIGKLIKDVDCQGIDSFVNPTTYLDAVDFRSMSYNSMLIKINKRMKIKVLAYYDDRIRSGKCTKKDVSDFMIVSERRCVWYLDYIMFKESRIDVELIKREYHEMTKKHCDVNLSDFVTLDEVLSCTIREIRERMTKRAVNFFKDVGFYYPRDLVYYSTECSKEYNRLFDEFYEKRLS